MQRNCLRLLNKIPANKGLLYGGGKMSSPVQVQQLRNKYLAPMRAWAPMDVFQNTMRDMDRQFRDFEREVNSVLRNLDLPRLGSLVDSLSSAEAALQPEVVTEGDTKKYRLTLHVGHNVDPENVKITLKDRMVTIESKYEHKSEDGRSRIYQEHTRSFTLPENIKVEDVKSLLTPDGFLQIEAPLPPGALEEPKPKEIPILKA